MKIKGIHTSGTVTIGESKMFDIDTFVFPHVPGLFKRDPKTNLALPELTEGCEWAWHGKGLITIKIDGYHIKIKPDHSGKLKPYKRLRGYTENTYVVVNEKDSMDKPIWEAFENLWNKEAGHFIAYGPGIKGNPIGAEKNLMLRIAPVCGQLLVSQNHMLKIRRGSAWSLQEFFDSIRAEFQESPEIGGLVFQLEEPTMNPVKFAKVTKKEFGILWPTIKNDSQKMLVM